MYFKAYNHNFGSTIQSSQFKMLNYRIDTNTESTWIIVKSFILLDKKKKMQVVIVIWKFIHRLLSLSIPKKSDRKIRHFSHRFFWSQRLAKLCLGQNCFWFESQQNYHYKIRQDFFLLFEYLEHFSRVSIIIINSSKCMFIWIQLPTLEVQKINSTEY